MLTEKFLQGPTTTPLSRRSVGRNVGTQGPNAGRKGIFEVFCTTYIYEMVFLLFVFFILRINQAFAAQERAKRCDLISNMMDAF